MAENMKCINIQAITIQQNDYELLDNESFTCFIAFIDLRYSLSSFTLDDDCEMTKKAKRLSLGHKIWSKFITRRSDQFHEKV